MNSTHATLLLRVTGLATVFAAGPLAACGSRSSLRVESTLDASISPGDVAAPLPDELPPGRDVGPGPEQPVIPTGCSWRFGPVHRPLDPADSLPGLIFDRPTVARTESGAVFSWRAYSTDARHSVAWLTRAVDLDGAPVGRSTMLFRRDDIFGFAASDRESILVRSDVHGLVAAFSAARNVCILAKLDEQGRPRAAPFELAVNDYCEDLAPSGEGFRVFVGPQPLGAYDRRVPFRVGLGPDFAARSTAVPAPSPLASRRIALANGYSAEAYIEDRDPTFHWRVYDPTGTPAGPPRALDAAESLAPSGDGFVHTRVEVSADFTALDATLRVEHFDRGGAPLGAGAYVLADYRRTDGVTIATDGRRHAAMWTRSDGGRVLQLFFEGSSLTSGPIPLPEVDPFGLCIALTSDGVLLFGGFGPALTLALRCR